MVGESEMIAQPGRVLDLGEWSTVVRRSDGHSAQLWTPVKRCGSTPGVRAPWYVCRFTFLDEVRIRVAQHRGPPAQG